MLKGCILGDPRSSDEPKILNLGCGEDTFGTHRVDIVQTKAATHVFDLEKGIPFPNEMFQLVVEQNILEHLRNVGFHLQEVNRVLCNGGKLVLVTDNAQCYTHYVFGTHTGRYRGQYTKSGDDLHYAVFTSEHIRNLLEKAGFHNIEINYMETGNPLAGWLDKLAQRFLPRAFALPRIGAVAFKRV